MSASIEAKHQPADRDWRSGGSNRAARVERRVARRRHVLPERGQEIAKRRQRQTMPRDRGGELRKRRLGGRRARFDRVERAFVAVERREPLRGRERRLRRRSRRRCARSDRSRRRPGAARCGTSERCDGKVFVMGDGHAKSGAVRRKDYISSENGTSADRAFSWRPGPGPAIMTRSAKAAAKVAELVDALDLGSSGAAHGGSSPPFRTIDSH